MRFFPPLLRRCLIAAWGLAAALPLPAARVALVIPDNPDLEAALTASLSKAPEIEIVERSALPSLAREATLAGAPLKIEGADSVVLAEKQPDGSVTARISDARTGAVLQITTSPPGLDSTLAAAWLGLRLRPWSAPATVERKFSLLGLRFETDSHVNRQTERSLNLALAAALQSSPNTLVLERWRLHDLLFEKALLGSEEEPFWQAAHLLDGSISQKDGQLKVRLRERTAGTERILETEGSAENLPALAAQLAGLVLRLDKSHETSRETEAAAYAHEAQWMLKHGLKFEAAQSVETAIALGDRSQSTEVLRIRAYAEAAYPEDSFAHACAIIQIRDDSLSAEKLSASIANAITMSDLVAAYVKRYASMERPPKPWLEYPADVGTQMLSFPMIVLHAAHKQEYWKTDAAALSDLRKATQRLIAAIRELPLSHEKEWLDMRKALYCRLIPYAAYWNDTPEDTLQFLETVLSPDFENEFPGGKSFARQHLSTLEFTPPAIGTVPADKPIEENRPRLAFWRVIDWNDPSGPRVETAWRNYVNSKLNSPNPLMQADGLAFLESSSPTYTEKRQKIHLLQAEFFLRHFDEMLGPHGEAIWGQIRQGVYTACSRIGPPEYQEKAIERYIGLLNSGRPLAKSFVGSLTTFIQPPNQERVAEAKAYRLLAALSEYSLTLGENSTNEDKIEFKNAQAAVQRYFPNLVPEYPPEAMPVTRAWIVAEHTPEELRRNTHFDPDSGIWHEGSLWFIDKEDRKIWKINPSTFETKIFAGPDRPVSANENRPQRTGASVSVRNHRPLLLGHKLYVPEQGSIWAFDTTSSHWSALSLPKTHYSLWQAGTKLYATFGEISGDGEVRHGDGSGVYEIDTADDSVRLIYSTRRRPPSHPLDGADGKRPFGVFPCLDGNPVVGLLGTSRPFRKMSDGREEALISPRLLDTLVSRQGENLFLNAEYRSPHLFHGLQRISPTGKLETLAWNPSSEISPPAEPVWKFPETITASRESANQIGYVAAMNGEDLLLLVYRFGTTPWGANLADLYRFRRGKPGARRISLSFRLPVNDEQTLKRWHRNTNPFQYPLIDPYGLTPTETGLVITGKAMPGFWFIPWTDLNSYEERTW